jgi:hypothetical protein
LTIGKSGMPVTSELRHQKPQNLEGIGTVHLQGQVEKDRAPSDFFSSQNWESEFHESRVQLQHKPQNRDERNPN